jgi:hypothetical protein
LRSYLSLHRLEIPSSSTIPNLDPQITQITRIGRGHGQLYNFTFRRAGSNCQKIHLDIFGLEADLADVNTSLRRVLIFNAVFIPILALALGVTAYFVQLEFRQLAEQQVLENAHLMMETAKASRVYTTEQIEPLLTREEARVAQGVKDLNDLLNTQLPQELERAVSGLPNPKERQTLQVLSEQIVQNVKQRPRTVPELQIVRVASLATPVPKMRPGR